MKPPNDPDDDQRRCFIRVGQDKAGHWLAQESGGRMEGRFVSFNAALHFARAERYGFPGADVVVVSDPIVPFVSFDPVGPGERAMARAA